MRVCVCPGNAASCLNNRGGADTHSYWTGNLEQTARHREPELEGARGGGGGGEERVEVFQPHNKKHNQSSSRPKAAKRRRIVSASVRASHLLRSRSPGAGSDLGRALQKTVMQCKITKGEAVEVDDEEEVGGGGDDK